MKNFCFERTISEYAQCDCCHKVSGVVKIHYTVRNYESKTGRLCKKLQAHRRSYWLCRDCFGELLTEYEQAQDRLTEWRTDHETD